MKFQLVLSLALSAIALVEAANINLDARHHLHHENTVTKTKTITDFLTKTVTVHDGLQTSSSNSKGNSNSSSNKNNNNDNNRGSSSQQSSGHSSSNNNNNEHSSGSNNGHDVSSSKGNNNNNNDNHGSGNSNSKTTTSIDRGVHTTTTSTSSKSTTTSSSDNGKGIDNSNGRGSTTTSSSSSSSTSSSSSLNSTSSGNNNDDPQTSLNLDPGVIQTGLEQDGQEVPEAGQVPSLTSNNNFINFCLTQNDVPLTNGKQIVDGSCNPTPMGRILATSKIPHSKFTFPKNFGTVPANKEFTISLAIVNLETGNFVNAQENYYAAPAQVNGDGVLVGHSHVVIELLPSLNSTEPTDPTKFAFFKGLNAAAVNGILTADVSVGLPAGAYRLSSINTAANHQPALAAVAQHGSIDDWVYFTAE